MKRILTIAVLTLILFVVGVGVPLAAIKHTSEPSLSCQAATYKFKDFANANGNTVLLTVLKNGVVLVQTTFTFNGSTAEKVLPIPLSGSGTIEAKASWNTNGHTGSATTGIGPFACETKTVTVTTGTTQTVTVPGPTTTNTVTINNPGAVVTLPAVTLPAVTLPAVTTPGKTVVKVVKSKPKIVVKVKWRTKVIHDRPKCPAPPPRCEGDCSPKKLKEGGSG